MAEREGNVNWTIIGIWVLIFNVIAIVIDEFLYFSYGIKFLGFGGTKAFFEFHVPLYLAMSFLLGLFSFRMHPKDMFYASFIGPLIFYFLDMVITIAQYVYGDTNILSEIYLNIGQDALLKYIFVSGIGSLMWVIVIVPFLAGGFLVGHVVAYTLVRKRAESKIFRMIEEREEQDD